MLWLSQRTRPFACGWKPWAGLPPVIVTPAGGVNSIEPIDCVEAWFARVAVTAVVCPEESSTAANTTLYGFLVVVAEAGPGRARHRPAARASRTDARRARTTDEGMRASWRPPRSEPTADLGPPIPPEPARQVNGSV
jgi:hypothetical protein